MSLTFVAQEDEDTYILGFLFLDTKTKVQLMTRELSIDTLEINIEPSVIIPPTRLPSEVFSSAGMAPFVTPVPSLHSPGKETRGGVLIVGGPDILFFELTSQEWRNKKSKKKEREERRSRSSHKAKQKETEDVEEEKSKKRKAAASVQWPWHEVTGYACLVHVYALLLTSPKLVSRR